MVAFVVMRIVHLVVQRVSDGWGHGAWWPSLIQGLLVEAVFPVEPPLPPPVDEEQAAGAQEQCTGAAGDAGDGAG
jgi:hypothetical protein